MNRKFWSKRKILATQRSVGKWDRIARGDGIDEGAANCTLCQLYIDNHCINCPIAVKVEERGCHKTLYDDWRAHARIIHADAWLPVSPAPKCKGCFDIAKHFANWINNLLPKEHRLKKEERL